MDGSHRWDEANAEAERLVAGCRAGDRGAWEKLWRRYLPMVEAVARRCGCTEEEAEEVGQRVALAALEGIEVLREPGKLAGWLAATARFQALEVIRTRGSAGWCAPEAAVGAEAAVTVEREEEAALLRAALVRLSPRCRRVIECLYLRDPAATYAEVAAAEGLSPGSVGPIRARCLERLRRIVEGLLGRCAAGGGVAGAGGGR